MAKKPDENRAEQLKRVAAEFCRVHDEWVADENRVVPDEIYFDAADALIESFGSGSIPGDCRTLADAVQEFAEAMEAYDERDNPSEAYPADSFWSAREKVANALAAFTASQRELPPLESIPSLASLSGITHLQIAKIYGFKDRNGQWMPHLVQRELDKPGSVLKTPGAVDGRDWRDPRVPADDGNAAAELHSKAIAAKRQRSAKSAKPCPETPRELWEQKVSIKQAARMLCRPEDEVAQLFGDFDAEREKALESGELVDATTQAIRELKAKGKTIVQIAETLQLSEQQVAEALRGKGKAA